MKEEEREKIARENERREKEKEIRLEEERQRRIEEERERAYQEKIAEEKRIEEENRRIKEWERKFDEEQRKKEEELIRKFYSDESHEDVKKRLKLRNRRELSFEKTNRASNVVKIFKKTEKILKVKRGFRTRSICGRFLTMFIQP